MPWPPGVVKARGGDRRGGCNGCQAAAAG